MDIKTVPIFVIGSHGCSQDTFYKKEMDEDFPSCSYFTVPENTIIIYFNNNAVESEGNKNIPFIKNLYDCDQELFYYIIDPKNYGINLDKNNSLSYRNSSFFRSLPLFSNFNYLCNIEIYPPGSKCPLVHLSFTPPTALPKSRSYFEGITELNNIVVPNLYEQLNFVDERKVYSPYLDLESKEGWIYTNKLITELLPSKSINSGIFFVSACRADFYKNTISGIREIIDIHPIARNCGDISYDLSVIEKLKKENPESIKNIELIEYKIKRRYEIKLLIDENIKRTYPQNDIFYNNNFLERLYAFTITENQNFNIVVNFSKININSSLIYKDSNSRLKLLGSKFNLLRSKLINRPNGENNNPELYDKLGYLYRLCFYYLKKNNDFPSPEIYGYFLRTIDEIFPSRSKEEIYANINSVIQPKYDFIIEGGNYEEKYAKYKSKYLSLKNKNKNINSSLE
jgi:hypothetical protein